MTQAVGAHPNRVSVVEKGAEAVKDSLGEITFELGNRTCSGGCDGDPIVSAEEKTKVCRSVTGGVGGARCQAKCSRSMPKAQGVSCVEQQAPGLGHLGRKNGSSSKGVLS